MIDWLEGIDRAIVLAVNSRHTPFLDELFWIISAKWTWIPFYVLLICLAWMKLGPKKTLIFITLTLATIAIVDLTSVLLFKETFQRYRPSHHALLTNKLHFYSLGKNDLYKGGMYGFVSSHATNFWALTVLAGLSLKPFYPKLIWIMAGLTVIICFSRIYLGVHYLSDVVAGGIWGSLLAYASYRFLIKPRLL